MQLTTDRLTIRSFTMEDAEDYAAIVADPEVMRYLGAPQDSAAATAYVADCVERDQATGISRYAVLQRHDDAFIGFCGFKALTEDLGGQVPQGTSWVDLGWRYRQSYWRQGYGYEAAEAVYAYGKNHLRLENIEIRTHQEKLRLPPNYREAGLRLAERLRITLRHLPTFPGGSRTGVRRRP